MKRKNDSDDGTDPPTDAGTFDHLRWLIQRLADLDARDDVTVETDYSVRGLSERPESRRRGDRASSEDSESDAHTRRARAGDVLVDSRWEGNTLVVVCDVAYADASNVGMQFDPDTGDVVVRDGRESTSVPTEWASARVADIRRNNDVLEVRLREDDDGSA